MVLALSMLLALGHVFHPQVAELKMTMRSMGVFEGMLEAFSYMIRMFSGALAGAGV